MQSNEEQIRRIAEQVALRVVSIYGGGGGSAASSLKAWVDQNYLSKEFFSSIIKVFDGTGSSASEIQPNDQFPSSMTNVNIKAMVGLWTEQYLTALGQGTGGGGGGGGALTDLTDVTITNPGGGQIIQYDQKTHHWKNVDLPTSVDMATVWAALAESTNEPINVSHFESAITGTFWGRTFDLTTHNSVAGDIDNADNIKINNNRAILWKDAGGTARSLLLFNSNNILHIGNKTYTIQMHVSTFEMVYGSNETLGLKLDGSGRLGIGVSTPTHKLHVSGGIYATDYVTALSDVRMKRIVSRFTIDVEKIASASLIRFTWNDKAGTDDTRTVHVGGIAQEWEKILPEAVQEAADGRLSMDYGKSGWAAAVSLAKKVVEQQKEIDELKERLATIETLLGIRK